MNSYEALRIMDRLCGSDRSSNKTLSSKPRTAACEEEQWWLNPPRFDGPTNRLERYLNAYVEINEGPALVPTGIKLDDGKFLIWDKGVIKSSLNNKLASFDIKSSKIVITKLEKMPKIFID
jgi:hypothetical protein